jgi:hypothetical protein
MLICCAWNLLNAREHNSMKTSSMRSWVLLQKLIGTQFFSIVNPTRCSNFSNLFYFWGNTQHVSDGLSVHHQEFKAVQTATDICQKDNAFCLLANRQQYLFDIYLLLYVQCGTPDDGRKDRPKHVEFYVTMRGPMNIRFTFIGLRSLVCCKGWRPGHFAPDKYLFLPPKVSLLWRSGGVCVVTWYQELCWR